MCFPSGIRRGRPSEASVGLTMCTTVSNGAGAPPAVRTASRRTLPPAGARRKSTQLPSGESAGVRKSPDTSRVAELPSGLIFQSLRARGFPEWFKIAMPAAFFAACLLGIRTGTRSR